MLRTRLFIAALGAVGVLTAPSRASAQAPAGTCFFEGYVVDCGDASGDTSISGSSILVSNTDESKLYQYANDYDDDGWEDAVDNCPRLANPGQADSDGDGIGDSCDLCANISDPQQLDTDGDGTGDACDSDIDNDGSLNDADNCRARANRDQMDTDGDGIGDACDPDDDGDEVDDLVDNCPLIPNPDQAPDDVSRWGADCDRDTDHDGVADSRDNCSDLSNADQADSDGDGRGDACDPDVDGDGKTNALDNCETVTNPDQTDDDRDGKGNACDDRFCYVVNGDAEHCLDKSEPFHVYSPAMHVRTGEMFRLRLFANRLSTPISYTWVVRRRPDGSSAAVENPSGQVRLSSSFEYFYVKDNVATFIADEPGVYDVELRAELVLPDTVSADFPRSDSYVMTVTADGSPVSAGGCSVGGASTKGGIGILTLAGLLIAFRLLESLRRKRPRRI